MKLQEEYRKIAQSSFLEKEGKYFYSSAKKSDSLNIWRLNYAFLPRRRPRKRQWVENYAIVSTLNDAFHKK